jgi:hypothetical protein
VYPGVKRTVSIYSTAENAPGKVKSSKSSESGESSKYRSVGGKRLGIVRYRRLHLAAGCSQVKSSQVVGQVVRQVK